MVFWVRALNKFSRGLPRAPPHFAISPDLPIVRAH
jgi:hypothetical protein